MATTRADLDRFAATHEGAAVLSFLRSHAKDLAPLFGMSPAELKEWASNYALGRTPRTPRQLELERKASVVYHRGRALVSSPMWNWDKKQFGALLLDARYAPDKNDRFASELKRHEIARAPLDNRRSVHEGDRTDCLADPARFRKLSTREWARWVAIYRVAENDDESPLIVALDRGATSLEDMSEHLVAWEGGVVFAITEALATTRAREMQEARR